LLVAQREKKEKKGIDQEGGKAESLVLSNEGVWKFSVVIIHIDQNGDIFEHKG
jgi:hypothetical protein